MGNVYNKFPGDSSSDMDLSDSQSLPGSSLPPNNLQSSPLKCGAHDEELLGEPTAKRSVEWFDASESMESSSTRSGRASAIMSVAKISREEAQAFWKSRQISENEEFWTPVSPSGFPKISSRSPTSRFFPKNFQQEKSPLATRFCSYPDRCWKKLKRNQRKSVEKEEVMSHSDDSDDDTDQHPESSDFRRGRSDSCSSTDTLAVFDDPEPESNLTESELKRLKKREKKKARQWNKEQLAKKQKLQLAQKLELREQRIAEHKRNMAEYAAAVAKPTVVKEPPPPRSTLPPSYPNSSTLVAVSSASPFSARSTSLMVGEPPGAPPNSPCSKMAPKDESFEVLVCGQRRKVTPFTPSRRPASESLDEVDNPGAQWMLPEHPPVYVPFSAAPIQQRAPAPAPRAPLQCHPPPTYYPSPALHPCAPSFVRIPAPPGLPHNQFIMPPVYPTIAPSLQRIPMHRNAPAFVVWSPIPQVVQVPFGAPPGLIRHHFPVGNPPQPSAPPKAQNFAAPPPKLTPGEQLRAQTIAALNSTSSVKKVEPTTCSEPPKPPMTPSEQLKAQTLATLKTTIPAPPAQKLTPGEQMKAHAIASLKSSAFTQQLDPKYLQKCDLIQKDPLKAPSNDAPTFVTSATLIMASSSEPVEPPKAVISSLKTVEPKKAENPVLAPKNSVISSSTWPKTRNSVSTPTKAKIPDFKLPLELKNAPESKIVDLHQEKAKSTDSEPSIAPKQPADLKMKGSHQEKAKSTDSEPKNAPNQSSKVSEQPKPPNIFEKLRSSGTINHDELITSGVASVLEGADDELPPAPASVPQESPPPSLSEQQAVNRVLGFSERCDEASFGIWSGWTSSKSQEPTLMSICKRMEPYFMNTRVFWCGASVNGDNLRDIFTEAHSGSIPPESWTILKQVCLFRPGYIEVFDRLIGCHLELVYRFGAQWEERDPKSDELYKLYNSMPPVEGLAKFYKKFEQVIIPDILHFLSNRSVSIYTFVCIVRVIEKEKLTVSDLYYLATLIYGTRQFYTRFNSQIKIIQIFESFGRRVVREVASDAPKTPTPKEIPLVTVRDFIDRLRPLIDDVIELLPNGVVNDKEFFAAVQLILAWRRETGVDIWKSITKDRAKFQEFHDAFNDTLRIEIRMGTIYLRKKTIHGDTEEIDKEKEEKTAEILEFEDFSASEMMLKSVLKAFPGVEHKEKRRVRFAEPTEIRAPAAPPIDVSEQKEEREETQVEEPKKEKTWLELEQEVMRELNMDSVPFEEFVRTRDAKQMHQFLIEWFKKRDLCRLGFILEKAMAETRQQLLEEILESLKSGEEMKRQLETLKKKHDEDQIVLQNRMAIISRFETYQVQVELYSRIDSLKEQMKEMKLEKENLVREEVREERAAMERTIREMKLKFEQQTKRLSDENARLKMENARILTANQQHNEQQASPPVNKQPLPKVPKPEKVPEEPLKLSKEAENRLKMLKKFEQEVCSTSIRRSVRRLLDNYFDSNRPNHRERKTAEKQWREWESAMDLIGERLSETVQMLELNVLEGLPVIPEISVPFSDTVLRKMIEAEQGTSEDIFREPEQHVAQQFSEEEEDGCIICYDTLEEGSEKISCSTCSGEYHYHCCRTWLKINSVCPKCARALKDPNEYPSLQ